MKKMKLMALALAATLALTACGGSEDAAKKDIKETNAVVEVAKGASGVVGDALKDAVKDVAEEVTPGSTFTRANFNSTEDYFMALTVAEIGDYSAPLWQHQYREDVNTYDWMLIGEYEGYRTEKIIDNIKYFFNEDTKEAICTSYDSKALQDAGIDTITIPAEVEGYKVVAIDGFGSGYNKFIKKIVIEDGVRQIHDAIKMFDVLEEVVIPDSVILITQNSLSNCKSLQSVTLPKNLMWLDGLNGSAITSIEIPSNVKYLEGISNSQVAEVTFAGEKLEAVYGKSFTDCPNLTALHLPDSVRLIGNHFASNSGIREFTLPASFEAIDASLSHPGEVAMINTPYVQNMGSDFLIWNDTLVGCYGDDATITIPDGVKIIAPYAFADSDSVTEVIVPESVETLGLGCISRLENIKSITLPSSITQICDIHIDRMDKMGSSDDLNIGNPYAGFTVKMTGDNKLVEAMCGKRWEIIK